MATAGKFKLDVPLDASQVKGFKPEKPVKVVVLTGEGRPLASKLVELNAKGLGQASFGFERSPGAVRVMVGPGDVADDEIGGLQTLNVAVAARAWLKPQLVLKPIRISAYYWRWWLRWCRTFTVHGRVVCADGSPVPGAKVCAFDVDNWWWWASFQQVGCATTDATGAFTLTFKWCCGWHPWWWWRLRDWKLDLDLVDRIQDLIRVRPDFPRIPRPQPLPDPVVFQELLGGLGTGPLRPSAARLQAFDPASLAPLREKLLARLPRPQDAALLQVWPWGPFEPWNDCTPDIAFRVTQNCDGVERTIVNEPWWRTRWNIDTEIDVKLVANDQACCLRPEDPPPENCVIPFSVCGVPSFDIGGNFGAPATPVGYLNPGENTVVADAPWAGVLRLSADVGVDYYEFEVTTTPANPASWVPVSPLSAGGFSRLYWDVPTTSMLPAHFPFTVIDGRNVCESRGHYEATHDPGNWGTGNDHIWFGTEFDTLMLWLTENNYNNGTHHLRLIGYDESGGQLQNRRVLPLCGTDNDNALAVTLDNRLPATLAREPRADVISVRLGGVEAGPCSNTQLKPTDTLEIDFIAYDLDAHLSEYTLHATYGKNLAVNLLGLLGLPGVTLTGIPLDGEPAALQAGPTYPAALLQGAPRPVWAGGGLRLHVPASAIRQAFPVTCCYQIELWVLKRTVASCDGNRPHRAFSFYSLTVNV